MATLDNYNATSRLYKRRVDGSRVPLQTNVTMDLGAPEPVTIVHNSNMLKLDSAQIYGKTIMGRTGGMEFTVVVVGFYTCSDEDGVWKFEMVYSARKGIFKEVPLPQFITKTQGAKVIGLLDTPQHQVEFNPAIQGMNEQEIRDFLATSPKQTPFSQLRLTN